MGLLDKVESPTDLKNLILSIYRLKHISKWNTAKIGKRFKLHPGIVSAVLKHGSPEDAFLNYMSDVRFMKKLGKLSDEKLEEYCSSIRETWLKMCKEAGIDPEGLKKSVEEKQEELEEKKIEASIAATVRKTILSELIKQAKRITMEWLTDVVNKGMLVEKYEEVFEKEMEKELKKKWVKERIKRELLNEALVLYLSGKIDREKFARLVVYSYLI